MKNWLRSHTQKLVSYMRDSTVFSADGRKFSQIYSRHINNCILIGLARAVPGLLSSGCRKDPGLVNPSTVVQVEKPFQVALIQTPYYPL